MVESSAISFMDPAITTICMWLVPSLIGQLRAYRRTLRRSPNWVRHKLRMEQQHPHQRLRLHVPGGRTNSHTTSITTNNGTTTNGYTTNDDNTTTTNSDTPFPAMTQIQAQETVQRAVTRATWQALLFATALYMMTALLISLWTRDLDFRTSYIVVGGSNFVAAAFIFFLSYSAPKWLGVYHSINDNDRRVPLGSSIPALCFNVRLRVLRTLFKVYPMMAPSFLGAKPATIPLSVLVGLVTGCLLCVIIDYGNRNMMLRHHKTAYALSLAGTIMVISAGLFAYGCGFVEEIWGADARASGIGKIEIVAFCVWLLGALVMHVLVWYVSKRMVSRGHFVVLRPRTFFGESIFQSQAKHGGAFLMDHSSSRNNHNNHTASGGGRMLDGSGSHRHGMGDHSFSTHQHPAMQPIAENDIHDEEEEEIDEETAGPADSKANVPNNNNNTNDQESPTTNNHQVESSLSTFINNGGNHQQNTTRDKPMEPNSEAARDPPFTVPSLEQPQPSLSPSSSMRVNIHHPNHPPEEETTEVSLSIDHLMAAKMTPAQLAAAAGEYDDPDHIEEEDAGIEETRCSLINQGCCGSNCGPAAYDKPWTYRCTNGLKWASWVLILAIMTLFVVLCVGAQFQETEIRRLLPVVDEALYDHMNERDVCAYDDRQPWQRKTDDPTNGTTTTTTTNWTRAEKVDRTQRSFGTPEEAHAAGYEILHCGACGKCSNWHDLRLEYATREMLGRVALECAKKVLIGGTFEDLVNCTMEKTGFQDPCARCWAWDYTCVRQKCLFISLRAFMINTVTNLQVGPHDITPSTCEEAMCEAPELTYPHEGFVICSGATRRRMNVTSTITRPGNQQCGIVDVLPWSEFFGPSEGNKDYDPSWGDTYDPIQ